MVKLRARKRDLEFRESLPAFDRRLGDADPLRYLTPSLRAMSRAAAEQWGYHVREALNTARFALFMAHSNQHPGAPGKVSRLFLKACWFDLAVLSLQGSWDKLAQLLRCSLGVTHWPSKNKKKPEATERTTSMSKMLSYMREKAKEAGRHLSPVDQMLEDFWSSCARTELDDRANALKHRQTVSWKGFAVVPVIEITHGAQPLKPEGARPNRQEVCWQLHAPVTETLPDGRKATARMHYGHKVQFDLDVAVRQVASVYRAFVPVAEAVAREYLGRASSDQGPLGP